MTPNLLDSLLDEAATLFEALAAAAGDPWSLESLLEKLDANDPRLTAGLVENLRSLGLAVAELKRLQASSNLSFSTIGSALETARKLSGAVHGLGQVSGSVYTALGTDLIHLAVLTKLRLASPLAYQLAVMTGLVDYLVLPPIHINGELVRYPQPVERLMLDRIGTLLTDPLRLVREQLPSPPLATAANAELTADIVIARIGGVLTALGLPWVYGFPTGDERFLGESAEQAAHTLVVYVPTEIAGDDANAGVCIELSPADGDDLGVVLTPFGQLTIQGTSGRWSVGLTLAADVEAFAFGGGKGVQILAGPATTAINAVATVSLPAGTPGTPATVFGPAGGSRLELGERRFSANLQAARSGMNVTLSADTGQSALVLHPGDGDGFLRSILPEDGLQAKFDLGLDWSNKHGLTFRGSGSLDATLPAGLSIGPLKVPTIHLNLLAGDRGLAVEVAASVGVLIGPVHAVVDRVGIASILTFPETGGNLGVADLDLHFKAPNGLGLAINAPGLTGGGYLRFDPEKQEYTGILELRILEKIAVKAIGLLTTRMPGGGKGYSLALIITAEGFAPIPLGFGFTLTSIGGLAAINRTFDDDALRSGLRNHALDSVMFPKDPIRNAAQVLSNLNKVFPPATGHHLFGPMARIAWGSPVLITAEVGVVLELGERLRMLILAQVAAILPKPENDLVRLQMDAVGVIDFDQGTAALDATLYDSRLLKKFTITGDAAMRVKWEGSPNFALAVGGLHPAFNPPPNFPKLQRIAISLAAGDNPRIRCEAYFALTANTVQFGARVDLFASASGFSIQGEFGFDVLIQFDPFYFSAGFRAQVQLKRGSTNLFKVRLEGSLAGPRPLHIKAKATFEILWWDVSIRVDRTLVKGEKLPPPEPIDVLPRLIEALNNPSNWTGRLPDRQRPPVSLRANTGSAADVLLHPLGTLTIKQGVVPLDLDISRFGQAAPAGARRFTIGIINPGGESQTAQPVNDFFAPAQFFEMSDEEKLSRPSFEPMVAGVSIGSDRFFFTANAADRLEVPQVEFETIMVGKKRTESRPGPPDHLYRLSPELLARQARFGAAGSSDIRRSGNARYRTTAGKHRIANEGWSIVAIDGLTVQPVPGIAANKPATYSEAAQALQTMKLENPGKAAGMKILRRSELQVAKEPVI